MRFALLPALAIFMTACSLAPIDPLIGAARDGRTDEIRALVKNGADPEQPGGVNGWTPLMHAIHKNQRRSVVALIEAGANPNGVCCGGKTPLMMAAGYGQTGIVADLIAHGADPRKQSEKGETALEFAITGVGDIDSWTLGSCQTATVRTLMDAAPDVVKSQNFRGRSSNWESRARKCSDVTRILEEKRAGL